MQTQQNSIHDGADFTQVLAVADGPHNTLPGRRTFIMLYTEMEAHSLSVLN